MGLNRRIAAKRASVLLASVLGVVPAACVSADIVSIDWGGGGGTGSSSQMGATESAGAIPATNWNSFNGLAAQATPQTLVNSTGAATPATVTWASNNTWNTPTPPAADTPGDLRMMKGYLDTNDFSATAGQTTTITVANLPAAIASTPYSVIVYYDGDNSTNERTIQSVISGATTGNATLYGRDAAGATFAGVYLLGQTPIDPLGGNTALVDSNSAAALLVPAGNFMVFTGLTGSGFTLSATGYVASDNTNRGPVNGIQIVSGNVPEPGAIGLIGLGTGALLARRRRQ
jgi:hypothetical protein